MPSVIEKSLLLTCIFQLVNMTRQNRVMSRNTDGALSCTDVMSTLKQVFLPNLIDHSNQEICRNREQHQLVERIQKP